MWLSWVLLTCWFGFRNKDAEATGIYSSQAWDDFDCDDVEKAYPIAGDEC